MGMRVTTGMSMNLYRYNLQNSTLNMNNSRNKVLTHRQFSSFAESPAAATQAWRLRRSLINTDIYLANNNDTYTRFNIAWATLGTVSSTLTDRDGRKADIYAASDATASGRTTLGQVLRETADSVIHAMNGAKSGENFLFAGDDELYAPFSWGTDLWGRGTLLYRGVDVNSGGVYDPTVDPGKRDETYNPNVPGSGRWGEIDPDTGLPENMPNKVTSEVDKAWVQYYKDLKAFNDAKAAWKQYDDDFEAWQKDHDAWEDANVVDGFELEEPMPPEKPAMDRVEEDDEPPESPATLYTKDKVNPPIVDTDVDDYGVPRDAYEILNKGVPAYNEDGTPKLDENNEQVYVPATGATRAWAEYYVDQGNYEKLKRMSKEQVTIDLGMGMLEDTNGFIDGTYFNRALPGINMLGYGIDEDGDPKNVCMIMRRLAEIYEGCHPDTGSYDYDDPSGTSEKAQALRAEAMRLLDKLKAGQENVTSQYVEVNAQSTFLEQNQGRLELEGDYLNEQLVGIENVDLADAITQFTWDYYCYSAALKVGTQLLSQSLIDYMN